MAEPMYERLGPVAGMAGLVLFVIGTFSAGMPPEPDASVLTIVGHYNDNRVSVLVGWSMVFAAVPLLLWFYVDLWALLRRAGGGRGVAAMTMLLAWVLAHAVAAAGAIPLVAVTFRGAAAFDGQLVQLAFDVHNLSLYALSAPMAGLAVLAASAVILQTRCLPVYLVGIGVAKALVAVVEVFGLLSRSGFDAAGFAGGLGAATWVVWVVAVAVEVLRRPVPRRRPAGRMAGHGADA